MSGDLQARSADPVRAIADAVLYEGYMLWPYRRSALKNQQRFTFGGVYPRAFARLGGDRSRIQMQCLLRVSPEARVELTVRWLHLVNRRPQQRVGSRWFQVDELRLGTERYLAWEEATEREYSTELPVGRLLHGGVRAEVHVPAGVEAERLGEDALLERSWRQLDGELVVAATPQAAGVVRLSATFANRCRARVSDRSEALRRSFLSAHMIARCPAGEFVSCTAPPSDLAEPAASCENDGLWPVLVGREGTLDTVLGSPIILSDHPSVAPESPGDLFDGGEIDVLLIHSIRALTDAEREEMRATDPRTREILERSVALAPEQLQQLYGAVREMRRVES